MTDNVTISDERGVRLIVLNRPEKKNALTQAMYAAINDAIAGTDADPALRVTVITAYGPVFTSGNDLAEFAAPTGDGGTLPDRPGNSAEAGDCCRQRASSRRRC